MQQNLNFDYVMCIFINHCMLCKHTCATWETRSLISGGIAAYNFGVKNVQTVAGTDVGTTGDDYSNDVIARAQHLIDCHGWQ